VLENCDVNSSLSSYSSLQVDSSNRELKHQPEIGFYEMFSHQGRAYLSACVSPYGNSTVTERQFALNLYERGLNVNRLLPWMLGQAPLLDRRNLWILMSISQPPGTGGTSIKTYATLENVWFSWYRWLQTNVSPI